MYDGDEASHLRARLEQHRRTLATLLLQKSRQGGEAFAIPPVIAGIHEARDAIRDVKTRLAALGHEVEDQVDDSPMRRDRPDIFPGPHQLPLEPHHYISRPDNGSGQPIEATLKQALSTPHGELLTVLYGMSGTGKSSLAVRVVCEFSATDFPDGILWGDLARSSTNDQILNFLDVLEHGWYRTQVQLRSSLRDRLWQSLADKRALLVLDNVRDARQLIDLLPPQPKNAGASRVLAISIQPLFDALLPAGVTIQLNPFGDAEAMDLFHRYLGDDAFNIYKPRLQEIAKRLEYLPQLLVTAAHDFSTNKSSPNTYLQALRKGNGQASILGNAVQEGLELVFSELPNDEAGLIELIGIFGEGDWRDSMLAAVALRPIAEVRQALTALAERSLIQMMGGHRYRVNALVREFSARRFNQQTPFRRQAAYTLLAHYCLDLAQDLAAKLRARPDQQFDISVSNSSVSEEFIGLFREQLMPDMSHFRVVLHWALEHEAWDILRRFSYLPYLELLKDFNATGFEIGMSLTMATLHEPVVRECRDSPELRIEALISSNEWSLRMSSTSQDARMQSGIAAQVVVTNPSSTDKDKKCELALEITAGHIVEGVFQHMSLVNGHWIAVRAPGLICRHLDIVGSEIIASDLSQSVLVHCDARHVKLRSSNFSYGLLRHVNLRGADLHSAILVGTVLEHVDLRDANLRGVNLSQAVLRHVDLRGADMDGANLSGAELIFVDLIGAHISNMRWAGAIPKAIFVEDVSYLHEIELAAQVQAFNQPEQFALRERRVEDLATGTPASLKNVDLRGAELMDRDLHEVEFSRSDLQAANLSKAQLARAILAPANLRGADLTGADLREAKLRGANLHAAVLTEANLTKADLSSAQLRLTRLSNAVLHQANLAGADCTYAELIKVDLSKAILKEIKLNHAMLSKANLTEVRLDRAEIRGTDAQGANFSGAEILQVECTETNMKHATLNAAKLSGSFSETTLIGLGSSHLILHCHHV